MKKAITVFFIYIITSTILVAQIPNSGFESWSSPNGYNMPDGWDNLNDATASMTTYTCMKGTPGSPGTAYLKLVSKNVSGMGVMPGVATAGMFDMSNMSAPVPMSGFAFNQRPQVFAGKWQYMPTGNDQGFVNILLTKWNSSMMMRDTIAYSMQMLQGMAMSWANFSINLTYMSLEFPDTAFITLSASGATPEANSSLYADTLRFEGSVAGTTGIAESNGLIKNVVVFPNPASDILKIQFNSLKNEAYTVELINAVGEIIRELNAGEVNGSKELDMNVSDVPKGNYLVKISSSKISSSKHITLQ